MVECHFTIYDVVTSRPLIFFRAPGADSSSNETKDPPSLLAVQFSSVLEARTSHGE